MSFEIIPPPAVARVKLSPLVDTLESGASVRVELVFAPTPDDYDDDTSDGKSDDGAIPPAVGSLVVSQKERPCEPWSKHASWTVPIFMRADGSAPADEGRFTACCMDTPIVAFRCRGDCCCHVPLSVGCPRTWHDVQLGLASRPVLLCLLSCLRLCVGVCCLCGCAVTLSDALAVELHTTIVKGSLRLDKNRVAFGPVAVGTTQIAKVRVGAGIAAVRFVPLSGLVTVTCGWRRVLVPWLMVFFLLLCSRQVRVWNDGKLPAQLVLAGLNPSGCFAFVNAPRSIEPGGVCGE